jgi:hypothetical protein
MAIKLLAMMTQKSLILWNAIPAKTQKKGKGKKKQSESWDVKKQNQSTNENKKKTEKLAMCNLTTCSLAPLALHEYKHPGANFFSKKKRVKTF